ncbi:MAG TPA: hypothetical protein VLA61_23025 [Ideonella sp.]|uniref:hypothetical protein n=1 Tax=Ideonella sp. TaxID=1929293 RepID=UPI002C87CA56|nr:hypothetical protein [Ideonella sp.]HSI51147.1 hypothetical protein [Ideonella sp.]
MDRLAFKTGLSALALAASCAAALPARAAEAYVNYDGFSGTNIDDTRWLGSERLRMVKSGVLYHSQRDLGDQTSNVGSTPTNHGTDFDEPARVLQMSAVVTVTAWDASTCAANVGSVASARARLIGSFFNAGPQTPGSRVNDVVAQARIYRDTASTDAAGVLRVLGMVSLCTSADCEQTLAIGTAGLGTATLAQAVKLRLDWDKANKRFVFTRDSQPALSVPYAQADSLAPSQPIKSLQTRTDLPNCFGGPRTWASIDANFDNVSVNVSATP